MIFVFLPKCHSCVQRLPLLTAEISEFTIGGPCLTYRSCHISLFVYRVGEWKGRGGVQTQNLQHCKGRNNCHSPTSIQKLSGCDNIMQCTTNLYEIWLWIHLIDHVESRYAYIWRSNTPPPLLSLYLHMLCGTMLLSRHHPLPCPSVYTGTSVYDPHWPDLVHRFRKLSNPCHWLPKESFVVIQSWFCKFYVFILFWWLHFEWCRI